MERLISFFGLFVMIGLAWLMSSHKRQVNPRIIIGGLFLQITFALVILLTVPGRFVFETLGSFFQQLLSFSDSGAAFLFDIHPDEGDAPLPPTYTLWRSFAFRILPTIVFFSSLMSVLYYMGIMQRIVEFFAWIMRKTLKTSGAETLSAAANIFVGQTEAPLVIRPFVASMTLSELNVVMVGGFATIAGGVFAAFVQFGANPGHLITASVISAPAALMIAKIMLPETEHSQTMGHVELALEEKSSNVIEAAAEGATAGMKLALNVAAMLIAFVALIHLANGVVGWFGGLFGWNWSLEQAFGYAFWPFAWLMGIPTTECFTAGQLLGTKMVVNEFLAYFQLGQIMESDKALVEAGQEAQRQLSDRSATILTYALCGFANFSSIGIQLGGIGGIAPERRGDLARLGLRAMIGGTLAAFMTACIAGILI
ncbi:MAG: NupC/NupG family nucleoside CNT transporter [Planctomycetota bacterium]|nr:NupC/NupG family nucleoside CNT transporter [Planctomycetota bacterium]